MARARNAERPNRIGPARIVVIKPGKFALGSLHCRAAVRALLVTNEARTAEQIEFGPLDDVQQATVEDVENPLVRILLLRFLRVAREKEIVYELPPGPSAAEIRERKLIHKEIDRMTGGKSSSLETIDGAEWHRLAEIAKAKIRARQKSA